MAILFSKELSETDVSHRLAIPSGKLDQIAPLSLGEEVSIAVIDATGHQWSFRLSTRKEGKYLKPVISGNQWRRFVTERNLRKGPDILAEIAEIAVNKPEIAAPGPDILAAYLQQGRALISELHYST
ncbi:hypothetical protein QYF36_011398 [Acer negundo]|nr:hypothetical protein QYF36_011398 [Acer negundo]